MNNDVAAAHSRMSRLIRESPAFTFEVAIILILHLKECDSPKLIAAVEKPELHAVMSSMTIISVSA